MKEPEDSLISEMHKWGFEDVEGKVDDVESARIHAINLGNWLAHNPMPPMDHLQIELDQNHALNVYLRDPNALKGVKTIQFTVPDPDPDNRYSFSPSCMEWLKEVPVEKIQITGRGYSALTIEELRRNPNLKGKIEIAARSDLPPRFDPNEEGDLPSF